MSRLAIIAAGLGGALWTVKVIAITAGNGSPLEAPLFLSGLACLLAAAVLAGFHRWWLTPLLIAGTIAIEALGITVIGGLYDGGNVGIEDESGILLAGLAWLAGAARASRPSRRSASPPASRTPRDSGTAPAPRHA